MTKTALTFTEGKVRRRSLSGWLPEQAGLVCGPFGIHRSEIGDDQYLVTHMPSGYIIARAQTPREAKKKVSALLALPIKWNFRSPKHLRKETKRQILETAGRYKRKVIVV